MSHHSRFPHRTNNKNEYIPNNPSSNDHHGFGERVEEVLQRARLLPHLAEGDAQHDAEADQTQHVAAALVLALDLIGFQLSWKMVEKLNE